MITTYSELIDELQNEKHWIDGSVQFYYDPGESPDFVWISRTSKSGSLTSTRADRMIRWEAFQELCDKKKVLVSSINGLSVTLFFYLTDL